MSDATELVYDELRRIAAAKLAREKPGQTLQATALVHEAYLRLVNVEGQPGWKSRRHFLAAAAQAMRRILVDRARAKRSARRGGSFQRHPMDDLDIVAPLPSDDVLALDEALKYFEQIDPVSAELVKLRFFTGLTIPEAAEVLGISFSTADRYWTYARAWIHARVKGGDTEDGNSKKPIKPPIL